MINPRLYSPDGRRGLGLDVSLGVRVFNQGKKRKIKKKKTTAHTMDIISSSSISPRLVKAPSLGCDGDTVIHALNDISADNTKQLFHLSLSHANHNHL